MSSYLFVIPSLSNGGAERVVSVLANGLVNRGHKVSIIIYFDTESQYHISKEVDVFNLSGGDEKKYSSMSCFKRMPLLRKMIKQINADYIVPFLPHVCIQVGLVTFDLHHRVIHTIRNNPQLSPKSRIQRMVRDVFVKLSWKTIVQNQQQADYFSSKYHRKLYILSNPISDSLFKIERKPDEGYCIVAAGRLIEQKNFPMLIHAMQVVVGTYPDIKLKIYGEGSLKPSLYELIQTIGLDDNIQLMGRTNDMPEVLSKASLFVLSSDFEGMPNALMEAMAIGVPCVSTDCPTGPRTLIVNGESGLLIKPNDVSEMATAICHMYENQIHAEEMAKLGKEKLQDMCNENKVIDSFLKICEA